MSDFPLIEKIEERKHNLDLDTNFNDLSLINYNKSPCPSPFNEVHSGLFYESEKNSPKTKKKSHYLGKKIKRKESNFSENSSIFKRNLSDNLFSNNDDEII